MKLPAFNIIHKMLPESVCTLVSVAMNFLANNLVRSFALYPVQYSR